jgi:hypothetical protein
MSENGKIRRYIDTDVIIFNVSFWTGFSGNSEKRDGKLEL